MWISIASGMLQSRNLTIMSQVVWEKSGRGVEGVMYKHSLFVREV